MVIGFLLLAAVQASAPPVDTRQPVTPQAAADQVARCGAGPVTIRSARELDMDVLVMAGAATVTDDQLACIDEAANVYDVELPPAVQPRLDRIREARGAAMMAQEGRQWLAAHRLLDRVPDYQPGRTDDAAFTRRIEALCSAKGAFQSRYGFHALSPEWATRHLKDAGREGPLECLLNVTMATGFPIEFIGNEQAAP